MRLCRFLADAFVVSSMVFAMSTAWAGSGSPLEGFVEVDGVRLQYLDWGGSGPALVLIHGLGDNAHVFDDFAPAFTKRFHVIAYTRRGSGGSDVQGPYDLGTLTEDLRGLMDALAIAKANLVGYSAGGGEVTEFATKYPTRVARIVYFEGGYDAADPDAAALIHALPLGFFDRPAEAMASLDAFRAYEKATLYPGLDDMRRIEANLREKVIIQSDGRVKDRVSKDVVDALYSALFTDKRRDYTRVRCPALAIYAESLYDLHVSDAHRREQLAAFEQRYWKPFQLKSIEQLRDELRDVQIVRVSGTHGDFFMTSRTQVVRAMERFLAASQ
jgi:pimeloyl-ACP methyl ester carboxylesterase